METIETFETIRPMTECRRGETTVAYLTRHHSVSNSTDVGLIIINYLINTKTDPSANIVAIDNRCNQVSMYNYPLNEDIGRTGLSQIMLATTTFEDEEAGFAALEMLKLYLDAMRPKDFDEEILLRNVNKLLGIELPRLAIREARNVEYRRESGAVRDSLLRSPPQVRARPILTPVLTRTRQDRDAYTLEGRR